MTLISDHSNVSDMADVVSFNPFQQTGTRYGLVQAFWASPDRVATDRTADVLEITFTGKLRVNWMQFDLARFPHVMSAEYWDDVKREWKPVIEVGGSVVERHIFGVVPAILPPPRSVVGRKHPQHTYAGHWRTERFSLVPTDMTKLRLVLSRRVSGKGPVDVYGNYVPYSLAVRNFSIGYQVASADDVPRTLPVPGDNDNGAYSQPFAAAADAAGSTIEFRTRILDASRVVLDNAPDASWRCEPQPDPQCVVSLYADVRTAKRQPQVIDRIFLDPVTVGPHLNVYFCQEEPTGNFQSGFQPLSADAVVVTQNVTATSESGLQFAPGGAYPANESMLLDNNAFDYRPDTPWWIGLVVTPHFNMPDPSLVTSPSTTHAVVFDTGVWQLTWTDTGLSLQTTSGDSINLGLPYQNGLQTTVFAAFDGTNYTLWASNEVDTESGSTVATSIPAQDSVAVMALGADVTQANYGQTDINALVLKQEIPPADGVAFAADPRAYTQVSEYAMDEPVTSRTNALLRFDPQTTLVSDDYPWMIFGGGHSQYEQMTWTPVPRDYTCHRGWLKLPPVRARYWKLEFTNLQPIYSDVLVPTQQLVRRFPNSVLQDFRQRASLANEPSLPVDDAHANIASYTNYVDTPSVVSTGGTGTGYTNTEVFVADDLQAADRLYDNMGENWAYQPFMSPLTAPRFNTTGVHVYQTELVSRTSKVAYSVGLRNLKFARSVHSATYDTPRYVDEFFDVSNLDTDQTSWVYDEEQVALTSGNSTGAQIVSQVMSSSRDVRGLQFAAQQSPPRQMLRDANFSDPRHQRWTPVGDARIERGFKTPAFDLLVPVMRTLAGGYWEDIAPAFGSWGAIQTAGIKWSDLENGTSRSPNDPSGNGIASEAVDVPEGGYVYAAARVYAERDLFAPLWLQIVDSVTGQVLNEEQLTVSRGRVAEAYTTYELNTGVVSGQRSSWSMLAGGAFFPSFSDSFHRADSTGLGRMDSGQIWTSLPSWNGQVNSPLDIRNNVATVDVAGARSAIDVGTPWGSLVVQLGNLVTPTPDTSLVNLGTLILTAGGKVQGPGTGYAYTTLTLAAGDTLQFDFMPTSQLPAGQSAGADASIRSWSMVITQNGTYVGTVSTAQPFSSVRGLSGGVGQTFTSFSWTPANILVPSANRIYELPIPRNGSFDSSGTVWTESGGRAWVLNGSYNLIDGGIVQSLRAPAGGSFTFGTDTQDLYGALTFQFTPSTTTTDKTTYYAALLDDTQSSQLLLRADGALVQNSPSLGLAVLKTAAVPSFSGPTTVLFLQTSALSAAFRTTYGLSSSFPQTLVFLNGPTVVSTYQGAGLFTGTTRSVMGFDGSQISGFTWGPDLGAIDPGKGQRTWNNVSGGGTLTWGDLARSSQKLHNPVVARVVQKVATQDVWYMDACAIYIDPIVWEFSNDGGQNWIPASTIRNNPNAAVMFDVSGAVANRLMYRVTAYDTDAWLAHLVIRPWYVGFLRDAPVLAESPEGPNLSPLDHYPPIEQDPNFMVWNHPIPREFFFAFRSLLPGTEAGRGYSPFVSERIVAG